MDLLRIVTNGNLLSISRIQVIKTNRRDYDLNNGVGSKLVVRMKINENLDIESFYKKSTFRLHKLKKEGRNTPVSFSL